MAETNHGPKQTANQTKIHFFYVSVILVGIIILLATRSWTELPGFTEYLNVAATVTALVLGVLAIIYAFVSSSSTNSFLGSVEASAREMRSVGGELRAIVSGGQELQKRAQLRNDELHEIVTSLRETIETLSHKTLEIAGAVETLPARFGELRDEVRRRTQAEATAKPESELRELWNGAAIASYLNNISLLGVVALKALLTAKSQDKFCDLRTLFNIRENAKTFEYVYGFLISATSAGIILFEFPEGGSLSKGIARSLDLPPHHLSAIEREWAERLGSEDKHTKLSMAKYAPRVNESLVDLEPQSAPG